MPTITDSEKYQTASTTGKVVKTMTITGVAGKQIKVESESVSLANEKSGIQTTATVYMKYADKKFAVAGWGVTDTEYTPRDYKKYSYTATTGKDVILQWELKTGVGGYAKMKDASCVYSLIDAEDTTEETTTENGTTTDETKQYIVVECKASEVEDITEAVKKISSSAGIHKCDKAE